jgi:hypothetical protein
MSAERTITALPMPPSQRLELRRLFPNEAPTREPLWLHVTTITGHEHTIALRGSASGSLIQFEELNSLCRDRKKRLAGRFGSIFTKLNSLQLGLVAYSYYDNQFVQLYTDDDGQQRYWVSDPVAEFQVV